MFALVWAARFAIIRMRADWRSRLIIVACVLLTAVIGAMSPLYTALMVQIGMIQRIDSQSAEMININSRIGLSSDNTNLDEVWGALDSSVREAAWKSFNAITPTWLHEIDIWSESAPMFVIHNDTEIPDLMLRTAYYENWENRVEILEGALVPSENAAISGAISLELADRFGLALGDIITLDQRGWASSQVVTVEIVAIVAPRDSDDYFWMSPSPLRFNSSQNGMEANILVTRDDLLSVIRDYTPQARSALGWRFLFDHDALAFGHIPQAVGQVNSFENTLKRILEIDYGFSSTFNTDLPRVLTSYSAEINLLNAPFGILMLQVAALVLFFLLITVTLAQRSERRVVAMLQNRGALDNQIVLLWTVEGIIICLIATFVAPFIAIHTLMALSPLLTNTDQLILELDVLPFIYSGVMSTLALGVLIVTLRRVLQLPLISAGGSTIRAARQSWWQRYYLDLLLAVMGGTALYRLLATDTPFATSLFGELHADPLLLIAPALLFIALGSITLRLFPPLTDVTAKLFAKRRGAEGALATWSVSRDPAHYARLAFLLALAIGVGWFAISFQATLTRSYTDQSRYRVGADVRLFEQPEQPNTIRTAAMETYATMDGVHAATSVFRIDNVNFSLDGSGVAAGQLLAVDPETFENTAYWRNDLGRLALPSSPDFPESGILLPSGTTRLGLSLRLRDSILNRQTGERTDGVLLISSLFEEFTFFARVRGADGTYSQIPIRPYAIEGVEDITDLSRFNLNVNAFAPPAQVEAETARLQAALDGVSGWVHFEGELTTDIVSPLTLDTLYWRTNLGNQWSPMVQRELEIAGLIPLDVNGQPLTNDLLALENWSLTLDNPNSIMTSQLEKMPMDGGDGWSLIWSQRQNRATVGISLYPPAPAIPSVISTSFAAENALEIGATFNLYIDSRPYTFVVEEISSYFPTLYADQSPFVVADLNILLYALNQRPEAAYYPNEILIALTDGVDTDAWLEAYTINAEDHMVLNAVTAVDVREQLAGDVLLLGLSRLLLIAFIISLTLSVISLLAYTALNAQNRHDQFAVLRALGMSSGRIAISVAFEQVIIFGVAALVGTTMGMLLSSQVLPTLAISTDRNAITPPFLVEVDTAALLLYAALLIGLLFLVLLVTTLLIRRMSLNQALRY